MLSEQFLIEVKLKGELIEDRSVYPFSLNAFRDFTSVRLHPKVTYFVGENGSGKSTLLEAIAAACGFDPEGGTRNFGFSTRASRSGLDRYLRLSRGVRKPRDGYFLRAESFYNVATEIEALDDDSELGPLGVRPPPVIDAYGGTSLHEQSHGESFLALLMDRFGGDSLFILDEPESALSPSRQLSMLRRMRELTNRNCQFLIATHSPIVMAYPDADILVLSDEGLKPTAYEDTEHFQVTKSFIGDRERMLRELFA